VVDWFINGGGKLASRILQWLFSVKKIWCANKPLKFMNSSFPLSTGLITFWIVQLILNCHFEPSSHFSCIIISFVNLFWIVRLIIFYYLRLHFVRLCECLRPSYFVWIIFDVVVIFSCLFMLLIFCVYVNKSSFLLYISSPKKIKNKNWNTGRAGPLDHLEPSKQVARPDRVMGFLGPG